MYLLPGINSIFAEIRIMNQNGVYVEAGRMSEINKGQMKHIEINGKEIVIANLDGKIYAFADRCGHMNARLSRGNISENTITCPLHAAKFDVTSGKKIAEPVMEPSPGLEPLPPKWQKYMEFAGQEAQYIKTYDQETYEVKVVGDTIKIQA